MLRKWYNKRAKVVKPQINTKENDNMNVKFYTKSYIFKISGIGSAPEKFEFTTVTARGIAPIFKQCNFDGQATEPAAEIAKLTEEHHPKVILVSDVEFFKKVVKQSKEDELTEVNVLISEDRGMMYYTKIGDGKSAMLIAYDDCNDN